MILFGRFGDCNTTSYVLHLRRNLIHRLGHKSSQMSVAMMIMMVITLRLLINFEVCKKCNGDGALAEIENRSVVNYSFNQPIHNDLQKTVQVQDAVASKQNLRKMLVAAENTLTRCPDKIDIRIAVFQQQNSKRQYNNCTQSTSSNVNSYKGVFCSRDKNQLYGKLSFESPEKLGYSHVYWYRGGNCNVEPSWASTSKTFSVSDGPSGAYALYTTHASVITSATMSGLEPNTFDIEYVRYCSNPTVCYPTSEAKVSLSVNEESQKRRGMVSFVNDADNAIDVPFVVSNERGGFLYDKYLLHFPFAANSAPWRNITVTNKFPFPLKIENIYIRGNLTNDFTIKQEAKDIGAGETRVLFSIKGLKEFNLPYEKQDVILVQTNVTLFMLPLSVQYTTILPTYLAKQPLCQMSMERSSGYTWRSHLALVHPYQLTSPYADLSHGIEILSWECSCPNLISVRYLTNSIGGLDNFIKSYCPQSQPTAISTAQIEAITVKPGKYAVFEVAHRNDSVGNCELLIDTPYESLRVDLKQDRIIDTIQTARPNVKNVESASNYKFVLSITPARIVFADCIVGKRCTASFAMHSQLPDNIKLLDVQPTTKDTRFTFLQKGTFVTPGDTYFTDSIAFYQIPANYVACKSEISDYIFRENTDWILTENNILHLSHVSDVHDRERLYAQFLEHSKNEHSLKFFASFEFAPGITIDGVVRTVWPRLSAQQTIKYGSVKVNAKVYRKLTIKNPMRDLNLIVQLVTKSESDNSYSYDYEPFRLDMDTIDHRRLHIVQGELIHPSTLVYEIPPKEKLSINVIFSPESKGSHSDTLLIRNNVNGIEMIDLVGKGVPHPESMSAHFFDYSSETVGSCCCGTLPKTLTSEVPILVTNEGSDDTIVRYLINDKLCEGGGFIVTNCSDVPFFWKSQTSIEVFVRFTPDFSTSDVEKVLTIELAKSKPISMKLGAFLEPNWYEECRSLVSRDFNTAKIVFYILNFCVYGMTSVSAFMLFKYTDVPEVLRDMMVDEYQMTTRMTISLFRNRSWVQGLQPSRKDQFFGYIEPTCEPDIIEPIPVQSTNNGSFNSSSNDTEISHFSLDDSAQEEKKLVKLKKKKGSVEELQPAKPSNKNKIKILADTNADKEPRKIYPGVRRKGHPGSEGSRIHFRGTIPIDQCEYIPTMALGKKEEKPETKEPEPESKVVQVDFLVENVNHMEETRIPRKERKRLEMEEEARKQREMEEENIKKKKESKELKDGTTLTTQSASMRLENKTVINNLHAKRFPKWEQKVKKTTIPLTYSKGKSFGVIPQGKSSKVEKSQNQGESSGELSKLQEGSDCSDVAVSENELPGPSNRIRTFENSGKTEFNSDNRAELKKESEPLLGKQEENGNRRKFEEKPTTSKGNAIDDSGRIERKVPENVAINIPPKFDFDSSSQSQIDSQIKKKKGKYGAGNKNLPTLNMSSAPRNERNSPPQMKNVQTYKKNAPVSLKTAEISPYSQNRKESSMTVPTPKSSPVYQNSKTLQPSKNLPSIPNACQIPKNSPNTNGSQNQKNWPIINDSQNQTIWPNTNVCQVPKRSPNSSNVCQISNDSTNSNTCQISKNSQNSKAYHPGIANAPRMLQNQNFNQNLRSSPIVCQIPQMSPSGNTSQIGHMMPQNPMPAIAVSYAFVPQPPPPPPIFAVVPRQYPFPNMSIMPPVNHAPPFVNAIPRSEPNCVRENRYKEDCAVRNSNLEEPIPTARELKRVEANQFGHSRYHGTFKPKASAKNENYELPVDVNEYYLLAPYQRAGLAARYLISTRDMDEEEDDWPLKRAETICPAPKICQVKFDPISNKYEVIEPGNEAEDKKNAENYEIWVDPNILNPLMSVLITPRDRSICEIDEEKWAITQCLIQIWEKPTEENDNKKKDPAKMFSILDVLWVQGESFSSSLNQMFETLNSERLKNIWANPELKQEQESTSEPKPMVEQTPEPKLEPEPKLVSAPEPKQESTLEPKLEPKSEPKLKPTDENIFVVRNPLLRNVEYDEVDVVGSKMHRCKPEPAIWVNS